MRRFPLLLFLLLTVHLDASAQGKSNLLCPNVKISAPPGLTMFGETINFSVLADEDLKKYGVEYEWTISEGTIIQGQKTPTIKVISEKGGIEIKATVKIIGLPENCTNSASESSVIAEQIADIFPEAEYGKVSLKDEYSRFDVVVMSLFNSLQTKAYVHLFVEKNEPIKQTKNRVEKLIKYIKFRRLEAKRFVFGIEKANHNRTEIYIFPENSDFLMCADCEIIKGEDVK